MKTRFCLLVSLLFLLTGGCGDQETGPDSAACYCGASCTSDRNCCDTSDDACIGGASLSADGLLARALLTQVAYQDPDNKDTPYYQTQWEDPARRQQPFFNGPPDQVQKQIDYIFEQIQYHRTDEVTILELDSGAYRAFTTGMENIAPGETGKNYFVISIRGTIFREADFQDDFANFGFGKTMDGPVPGSTVTKKTYDDYTTYLKQPILKAVGENPGRDVYVLGHSLGGPMAAYAAQDLVGNPNVRSVSLYTYNSFRPGNKALADWLNTRLDENIRHSTSADAISTLPPQSLPWTPYHTGISYVTKIAFGKQQEGSASYTSVEFLGNETFSTDDPAIKNFVDLKNQYGLAKIIDAHDFFAFGADILTTTPKRADIPFLN